MTTKTVTSVLDNIDSWESSHGTLYSVVAFAGKETIRANKKSYDAALELQGLLKEAVGVEQDFVLESDGVSKAGNPKWKLKAFGAGTASSAAEAPKGTAPHLGSTPSRSTEADIRKAVAMKAAAVFAQGGSLNDLERTYRFIDGLLAEPSAGSFPPFHPADAGGGVADSGPPSASPPPPATTSPEATEYTTKPKGLGTSAEGTTSGASSAATVVGAADSSGGTEFGEGSCPPHDPDMSVEPKGIGRRPCRKCGAWVR